MRLTKNTQINATPLLGFGTKINDDDQKIYSRKFIFNVSLMNFIDSCVVGKHMVEEALKERHLIAKGVSPVDI